MLNRNTKYSNCVMNLEADLSSVSGKSNPSLLQEHNVDCEKCRNKIATTTNCYQQDGVRATSIHKVHQIIATDLYDLAKYDRDRKFLGKIANQRSHLTKYETERFSELCKELGGLV